MLHSVLLVVAESLFIQRCDCTFNFLFLFLKGMVEAVLSIFSYDNELLCLSFTQKKKKMQQQNVHVSTKAMIEEGKPLRSQKLIKKKRMFCLCIFLPFFFLFFLHS